MNSLPEELIVSIGNLITFDDLLPFALTSKLTHRCLSKRLLAQKKYRKHRWTDDRDPLNLPELLRRAIFGGVDSQDPLSHVRYAHFRDRRVRWQHWRVTFPNRLYDPLRGDENYQSVDDRAQGYRESTENYFRHGEVSVYRRIFIEELGMPFDDVDPWMRKLQNGNEQPLKALLIALLPRIKELTLFG